MNTIKKYNQTLNRLYNINITNGVKLGLKNVKALNSHLGNPIKKFNSVHIAGTNGKGSVATYISKGLEKKFSKIGLYTSPHISSFRERIRINGQMIKKSEVVELMEEIFSVAEKFNIPATFFELTTLLAFKYFAENGVDFAVIETGLGGRLDATNIIKPILSIITTIGFDHREFLGNTLKEIAIEKAGIIKKGIPVIIGPKAGPIPSPANSPCIRIENNFNDFYDENRAIAKKALEYLEIEIKIINDVLNTELPCRRQIVNIGNQKFYMDAAHNEQALLALFQTLSKKKTIQAICSFSKDKELYKCLKIVSQNVNLIHIVKKSHDRLANYKILENNLKSLNANYQVHDSIKKAVDIAKSINNDCVITGSFYIMSEAKFILGI